MRRVLVTGGRDYRDARVVRAWLDKLHAQKEITLIIHGGCRMTKWPATGLVTYDGADGLADDWAKDVGVPISVFPADWTEHGNSAGPRRNTKMLHESKPDIVLAFPGDRGTFDMVSKARGEQQSFDRRLGQSLLIIEVQPDGGIVK